MTDKTSIWEYFGEFPPEQETSPIHSNNFNKKAKYSDKIHINQELTWIKSLLHPSMEHQFFKVEVLSLVISSKSHIICNINANEAHFPNFHSLTGFFNVWWWKNSLSKIEFSVLQELTNNFEFLKNIVSNTQLIEKHKPFYLLLNNPKVVADLNDHTRGLVTCKRFLIVQ